MHNSYLLGRFRKVNGDTTAYDPVNIHNLTVIKHMSFIKLIVIRFVSSTTLYIINKTINFDSRAALIMIS